jgi:hypothetical protein
MTGLAEDAVREKYEALGYTVIHRGPPDFLLLKPGQPLVFREVKCPSDRLTEDQKTWIRALNALGADAAVEYYPGRPPRKERPGPLPELTWRAIERRLRKNRRLTTATLLMEACRGLVELDAPLFPSRKSWGFLPLILGELNRFNEPDTPHQRTSGAVTLERFF